MFTHPDPLGQLAAEHHRQMLAEARQRTLRHQRGRPSSRTPDIALRITRRLATAITRADRGRGDPALPVQRPAGRAVAASSDRGVIHEAPWSSA
jgi:hypothetical protein